MKLYECHKHGVQVGERCPLCEVRAYIPVPMTYPNGNVHPATVQKRAVVPFVAIGRAIMRGSEHVAQAVSGTMAKRIANALNSYRPDSRGQ